MSNLLKILAELLVKLFEISQTVLDKLTKHLSKEIAILIYVTFAVAFIFETIFITLLAALVVMRLFLS